LAAPGNSSIPVANFDEQLGLTFTQNFSDLSNNVTAVKQQDLYGYGPAYLLNGLSNLGYWYQVGISWDWPFLSGGHASGFGFNFEVFSFNGSSIFPQSAGGLVNFSGSVNPGDNVELSLMFNGANVTMQAVDWDTKAVASVGYSSFGANHFVGSPHSISNIKGFFTGLMTEQYHVSQFNGSERKVTYSGLNISSAWMWVDEFNANTSAVIFFGSTPVSYVSNPGDFRDFFYRGSTLISNAYEFITGTSGSVLLTASYSEIGGESSIVPKFTYVANGSIESVDLGTSPTTYLADNGSTWGVSVNIPGQSSGERWTTPDTTSGVATGLNPIKIVYYHQYLEIFSFSILGGGSGFESPNLTFVNYGTSNAIILGNEGLGIWMDAGSAWNASSLLSGSSSQERWVSNDSIGTAISSQNVSMDYVHQNLIAVGFSMVGGGSGFTAPHIVSRSLNGTVNATLSTAPVAIWLNSGAQWRVNSILEGSTASQRWETPVSAGVVNLSDIFPAYYHQSFVSLFYAILDGGTGFTPPRINLTMFGERLNIALNSSVWVDYGTPYNYPQMLEGSNNVQRWIGNSVDGMILSQGSITARYQTQYFVNIEEPSIEGGNVGPISGWYNASSLLRLTAMSDPGWKFVGWVGNGTASYSGNVSNTSVTLNSPVSEVAAFYPGLTISSSQGGSVDYSFSGKVGTVGSGDTATIFVPPLTEISLSAPSSSFLDLFTSWQGAINSGRESVTIQVNSPQTIRATFGFNYLIDILVAIAVALALTASILSILKRYKSKK
jgi:hypothetical protein